MTSSNGPILSDIKRCSDDGIRINISRGEISRAEPCNICRVLTIRVTSHKLSSESVWSYYAQCDQCCSAQALLVCRTGGLLRKGI